MEGGEGGREEGKMEGEKREEGREGWKKEGGRKGGREGGRDGRGREEGGRDGRGRAGGREKGNGEREGRRREVRETNKRKNGCMLVTCMLSSPGRKLCIKYQTKYYEKLHSVSVSSSLKEELQRLEDSLDWFNIMVYRKAAIKVAVSFQGAMK